MKKYYCAFVSSQQGFTLIEVMVALAILAVVAVAASQASGSYLKATERLRVATLAHFVAQNTTAQLKMSPPTINTVQTRRVTQQGQDWQVTITPTQQSTSLKSMAVDKLKQIDISVAPVVDGEVKNSVTDLTLLLSSTEQF